MSEEKKVTPTEFTGNVCNQMMQMVTALEKGNNELREKLEKSEELCETQRQLIKSLQPSQEAKELGDGTVS